MKIQIHEFDGCFSIDITAETMADAALLVRMARDTTKETRHFSTTPFRDGEFITHITLGKRRRSRAVIHQGEGSAK